MNRITTPLCLMIVTLLCGCADSPPAKLASPAVLASFNLASAGDSPNSFEGLWPVQKVCDEHHKDGHGGSGKAHIAEDGYYGIYRIGTSKQFGILASTDTSPDFVSDWNDCKLTYKPHTGKFIPPSGTFQCDKDFSGNFGVLEGTCNVHGSGHKVQVYMLHQGGYHAGPAPVISYYDPAVDELHKGYLH